MQIPALLTSSSARQFFFILALIALVVSAGCNSAKTETVGPAFSVASTHSGNFSIGQQGATYSVTVTNSGNAATNGTTVTATDTVPSGMTLVSMAGTGWTCAGNSCTRTDVLAAGASYPAITVTVNVLATATSPETNQVSASGGGAAATSPTGTDSTVINTPILAIASTHSGSFVQSQQGVYTVTVSNGAGATVVPTIGTVSATDTVPSGMTLVSMSGTGWTCTTLPTCTRADALAVGASYPAITVTVNVNANATTPENNSVSVSGGGSPSASGTDSTIILTPATLSISKSHVGNFSQAQQGATYSVTVSNAAGAAPTSGTVTVTEAAPSGLTLAAMSGTGWTCTALPVCTRADALAAGASYPVITVTVNVAANATSPQINSVSVSGGGSAGANTTNSTTILAPALSITKSHTGSFALGQQNAVYTVTVSNGANAGTTSGTVTVTDTVPTGETLVSMAGTGWTCTTLPICTRADALAAGASYPAITVTVNVAANATTPQVNAVSVTGGNSAAANTTDSTVILEPALSITKSHTGNFTVGQNGVFTIAVGNTGAAATTGAITVTDTLAAGLTFVSGTGTNWTCSAVGQAVSCTNPGPIAAAGAAGNITLTVAVAINAPASIANTATVSTTNSANASSTDTVTVVSPDLAIAKSHSGSFTAGTNGVFTIAVSNVGTAPTSGAISVADTLNSAFSFVGGTGTGWTCGAAGQAVTCTNAGPIANGASAGNITLTVAVNPATTSGNITNTATVATAGDNNAANNSSTDTVSVNASPDLAIVKTATSNFTAGANATFGIAVNNVSTGPTIGAITVTDTLNASFTFVSGTGTGWTCGAVAQLVTCTNPGPIAGSASAGNITLTVSVNPAATGSISNTATVQTTDDNNAANNSSTISVPITVSPDLAITKTVVGSFTGGTNGTFQIAVKNNGVSTTTGTITVTDTLNGAFTFVSGTGTGWTCGAAGQLVTCTDTTAIASGASAGNITLTVAIGAGASGNISNTATVSDPGDTTDTGDKTSTTSATVNASPDLAIVKSAMGTFTAGLHATFIIAVNNVSTGPTIGGITVTDTLNSNFTFVSGTGTGWTCGAAAQVVTCTNPGPIAGNASIGNITLTVAVNPSASGSISNTATVQTTDDNNAANNSSTISVPIIAAAPDLSITKSAVGTFAAGSNGTFQIAVSNIGSAPTTGTITVTDTLNSAFTFVSGSGTNWTCGAAGQLVTCTNTTAIANGSSAGNVTLTVAISGTASGSISNTATVSDPGDTTDVADKSSTTNATIGSVNTCAGLPTGNESLLHGQYAILLNGWQGSGNGTPVAIAASFAADGTGKISSLTGGIGGDLDINTASGGAQHVTITPSGSGIASAYRVGPDGTGAGYLGCAIMATSNPGLSVTFTFSLGGVVSGVASKGRIIEFDDTTGSGSRTAGEMRLQDATAFSSGNTSALHANYAFGADGQTLSGHAAIAGSFVLNPATGNFTSVNVDSDVAGTLATNISGTGGIPLGVVSPVDGRATLTLTFTGQPTGTDAIYIVNANEWFSMGIDSFAGGSPIQTGRAIVSASSYTGLASQMMFHITGSGPCGSGGTTAPCAQVGIGLVNPTATNSTSGTFTGDVYNYDMVDGAQAQNFPAGSPGTYSLTDVTGRVALANAGDNPPVMYLASPASNTDPFIAFFVGTDTSAISGFGELGAASSITTASMAGNYFFGNEDSGDNTVKTQMGVAAIASSGVISGTGYASGQSGLTTSAAPNGTLVITNLGSAGNAAPGTGNLGTGTIAITNGKRLFIIDESGGSASIVIIELQ